MTDFRISLGEATITYFDFADDVVIFAETLEVLMGAMVTLSTKPVPLGLIKTKIHKFVAFFDENIDLPPPVAVKGELVSFVDSFVYIGSAIGSGARSFMEINRCLEIASSVLNSRSV